MIYFVAGMRNAHAVLARAGKGGVPGIGGADLHHDGECEIASPRSEMLSVSRIQNQN